MSAIEQDGRKGPGTPRTRRTRRALHEALGTLLRRRPYEDIPIKEILAHAGVARSTFYDHFRDKEELLLSAFEDIVAFGSHDGRASSSRERVLRFSLRMFEHVARHRPMPATGDATVHPGRAVHPQLRRMIEDHVARELMRSRTASRAQLAASQVASTFIVVFEWWLSAEPQLDLREADDIFRSLVAPALV